MVQNNGSTTAISRRRSTVAAAFSNGGGGRLATGDRRDRARRPQFEQIQRRRWCGGSRMEAMSGDEVDPEYEVAVINSEDEVSGRTITYFQEITVEDPPCVICMRILFNAVVLGCGHGFCYRCFVRNFNVRRFCAECRFHVHYRPRICYLLYFLVMGLYRDVYESRLNHCQKIERIKGKVPRIDFRRKDQFDHLLRLRRDELNAADFKCTACLKLLFQPIALHCGHVFCKECILKRDGDGYRCPLCLRLHPVPVLKESIHIKAFLIQMFPEEYSGRTASPADPHQASTSGTAFEVSSEEEVGTSEKGFMIMIMYAGQGFKRTFCYCPVISCKI